MKVTLKDKTIEECGILEKLYRKAGYILVSLTPTKESRHLFEDNYWDIALENAKGAASAFIDYRNE